MLVDAQTLMIVENLVSFMLILDEADEINTLYSDLYNAFWPRARETAGSWK